jgi:hypothetical protein
LFRRVTNEKEICETNALFWEVRVVSLCVESAAVDDASVLLADSTSVSQHCDGTDVFFLAPDTIFSNPGGNFKFVPSASDGAETLSLMATDYTGKWYMNETPWRWYSL